MKLISNPLVMVQVCEIVLCQKVISAKYKYFWGVKVKSRLTKTALAAKFSKNLMGLNFFCRKGGMLRRPKRRF